MFWEVWAIPSANLITAEATEGDALRVVRDLLSADWTADELTLIFDDPALPVEELPPAVTGEELARRVAALKPTEARRSA